MFYILIWITCSVSMILFNKAVLSAWEFPFPIFLTTWHMIVSTVLTQILSRSTDLLPAVKEGKITSSHIKNSFVPIALLFAVSLVCCNKAYVYLSVSYIQMLKAATPVVVLLLSSTLGLENPTFMELNIIVVISLGVALASLGELLFSWTGFFFQISGIFAESGRLVLTGVLLKRLKLDSLSTLYYVAPLCAIINSIVFIFLEASDIPWERVFTGSFVAMLLFNGAVAFSLNIASVMLISHTSPLILTLAGILKDILLVFMSMAIFGSPVTTLQFLGYSVTLLALNLHKEYKKLIPTESSLRSDTSEKPPSDPGTQTNSSEKA